MFLKQSVDEVFTTMLDTVAAHASGVFKFILTRGSSIGTRAVFVARSSWSRRELGGAASNRTTRVCDSNTGWPPRSSKVGMAAS